MVEIPTFAFSGWNPYIPYEDIQQVCILHSVYLFLYYFFYLVDIIIKLFSEIYVFMRFDQKKFITLLEPKIYSRLLAKENLCESEISGLFKEEELHTACTELEI